MNTNNNSIRSNSDNYQSFVALLQDLGDISRNRKMNKDEISYYTSKDMKNAYDVLIELLGNLTREQLFRTGDEPFLYYHRMNEAKYHIKRIILETSGIDVDVV